MRFSPAILSAFPTVTDAQASSFDMSLDLKYDGVFSSGHLGVKVSTSSKATQEFFSSGEGMMLISEAKCLTHKISINKMVLPRVTFWDRGWIRQQ